MNFILSAFALQDIGQRENQEDCFYPPFKDPCHFDETNRDWSFYDGTPHTDDRMFIVCDGMGGHDRGEVASRIVTTVMSKSLMNAASIEGAFPDEMLQGAVDEALDALAAQDDPKEERKMGTTMTVLKFHANGATIGHIGDSRVYHFRPSEAGSVTSPSSLLLFRTDDHTVVNEMVKRGQMSVEQALTSPKRHILSRSMTSAKEYRPEVQIDHITDIKPDDIFLLCSDGVYENMDDEALSVLMCDPNLNDVERAQELLRQCKDNKDNHTAIIVRVRAVMNADESELSKDVLPVGTALKSKNYVYHIERSLGNGAFGNTYLVNTAVSMQGQLGTVHTEVKVALKEFYMHEDMERRGSDVVIKTREELVLHYREKFRQEAMKLAMLSHPNIVRVLEVFEANNTIYYSMEYLPDGSLNDYVNAKCGLPEQEALGCIRQIGSALMYLHNNRMLHLDVKPANVMRNSNGTLKLIDFGLAKKYEEDGDAESSSTLGFGTPGYAPPEQSDRTKKLGFSPQLDVYALGATYYKLLTAQKPDSAIAILNNGISTMPLVRKHVSQESIDAIKAAMQPIAENRLKTVMEFLDMLPRIGNQIALKPKKRRRTIYVVLAVVAVALLLLVGGITWYQYDELNKVFGDNETSVIDKSLDIPMVDVRGGDFLMGSKAKGAEDDEQPVHKVTLKSFRLSKYEVTQSLWKAVMENRKPSKSKNGDCPVYNVTWDAVQIFIQRLNERTGRHFRLPTEAEWEYAASGGNTKDRTLAPLDSIAWFDGNSEDYIHPVGTLKPNALGIYDMFGNVWEYCSDYYGPYTKEPQSNPKGPSTGQCHVVRGGSWSNSGHYCRPTYRQDDSMMAKSEDIGFRLAEDK